MSPLSPWKYVSRNGLKVLPVFGVIAVAVFAVAVTAVLTGSMIAASRRVWLQPYERYSLVLGLRGPVPADVVSRLRRDSRVAALLPVATSSVRVPGIFGSETRPVLALRAEDMPVFLRHVGLRLAEGRLPARGEAAIALHRDIAKGKGLWIGSAVGRDVDEDDALLGRYRVVGILEGRYPFALVSYERLAGAAAGAPGGPRAFVVFPRAGQESRLWRQLQGLALAELSVYTYDKEARRFAREIANLDLMVWVLNLITVVALSLAVGLLNLIFVRERMGEYGILAAMGYDHWFLLRRTAVEVVAVAALAWIVGLALSRGTLAVIASVAYTPKGIHLTGIDGRVLAYTAPVPVLTAVFSLAMVFLTLRRLDPVSIVERRD